MKKLILLFAGLLSICFIEAQTPAFVGAEGGGMYTTGGRGGTVYYVNTLEDNETGNTSSKEGSLRWCLKQNGTKTILFKVSGTIHLSKQIKITEGNITIAGQSAPGDGVCIADYPVQIAADNVIIRYLRFRMGDEKISSGEADGADALNGRFFKNVIIDHCSMSWSTDECVSFYDCENFTMQWCIISESLRLSKHDKGPHGYGGIWGGTNATFHHNLMAHHDSRNPRLGPGQTAAPHTETVDLRNNVIYNWVSNSCYGGEAMNANLINNYYKPGPSTPTGSKRGRILSPDKETSNSSSQRYNIWGQFYIDGNVVDGTDTHSTNATKDNWTYGVYNQFHSSYTTVSDEEKKSMRMDKPFVINDVTTHTAHIAYEQVLAYAGASLSRDSQDKRIVDETRNGTAPFVGLSVYNGYGKDYPGSSVDWKSKGYPKAGIIDSQSDLKPENAGNNWSAWPALSQNVTITDTNRDGIPDNWLETNHPGKSANDKNDEGYTYLEVYLNGLVRSITEEQNKQETSGIKLGKHNDAGLNILYNTSGELHIRYNPTPIRKLTIYDLAGKPVKSKSPNSTDAQINVSGLNRGVYIIRALLADGTILNSKFIK